MGALRAPAWPWLLSEPGILHARAGCAETRRYRRRLPQSGSSSSSTSNQTNADEEKRKVSPQRPQRKNRGDGEVFFRKRISYLCFSSVSSVVNFLVLAVRPCSPETRCA